MDLYLVEFGSENPGDTCKHFVRASSPQEAITRTMTEMWGATETNDRVRVSGPYRELAWSAWSSL